MDDHQWSLIQDNMDKILGFLVEFAHQFLQYLEEKNAIDGNIRSVVNKEATFDRDLMFRTLKMLKELPNGWAGLSGFIEKYNREDLLVAQKVEPIDLTTDKAVLAEFTSAVAKRYLESYSFITSHLEQEGNRQHIEDFWVPLEIQYKNGGAVVHHLWMQKQLSTDPSHFVIVKGDPGTGKTTLVKKICYDWATQQGKSEFHQYSPFSVVLAVPLRSARQLDFGVYVQLAVDYFVSILSNFESKKATLTRLATALGSKLLVILDGLDEYPSSNFANCPLAELFAPPLVRVSPCNSTPKQRSCKVMITSRPYALEQINQDFHPIRGQMCPLDSKNLAHFVNNYCKSAEGKAKVMKYLKNELVIKTPLILSFVCFLADSDWQIDLPSSLTLIYDMLIWQMILREKKGVVRLKETIEYKTWRASKLVKSTSKLAFLGCSNLDDNGKISIQLEFDKEIRTNCEVTEDSFNCGFLLDKLNVVKDCHMADFPHRSIQEFFAALHCYQTILNDIKEERNSIVKAILSQDDSHVGRFLFGLFCAEKNFDQMSDWLQISFADIQFCKQRGIANLINSVERSLADCSEEEQVKMGRCLFNSIELIEAQIVAGWNLEWTACEGLSDLHPKHHCIIAGLYIGALRTLDCTHIYNWYLADVNQTKLARLVAIYSDPPNHDWLKEFERIEIFTASGIELNWIDNLWQPRLLPPINVVHLLSGSMYAKFVVTIQIERQTTSDVSELRTFLLHYGTDEKLDYLAKLDQFKTTIFCVKEVEVSKRQIRSPFGSMEVNSFKLTVTVNQSVSQSTLICSLIKLALEVDYTDIRAVAAGGAIQPVFGIVRKLKDLMAAKQFCRDKPQIITRAHDIWKYTYIGNHGTFEPDRLVELQLFDTIESIIHVLPKLRYSQLTSELKRDLIAMLLSCVERANILIREAHLYIHSAQPLLARARAAREYRYIEHEELFHRERVCQINIPNSYLKEGKRILSHLSRPNREFYDRGYMNDRIVMLLNHIVSKSADKSKIGEMGAVEIICDSIALWLTERPDEDSPLEHCWMCLNNICLDSESNQKRFLQCKISEMSSIDGIELFKRCRQNGLKHIGLVEIMMRLMVKLSGNQSLRQELEKYCELFWDIWCQNVFESSQAEKFDDIKDFERILISFRCAKVLVNLVDPQIKWPLENRTISGVEICPFQTISEWKLNTETFLTYSSFKDDLTNLVEKSPQHQLMTVWTLANCTITNAATYCPILRVEQAIQFLTEITEHPNTPKEVEHLAQLVIDNINNYTKSLQSVAATEESVGLTEAKTPPSVDLNVNSSKRRRSF